MKTLSDRSNLDHLRKQAKDLRAMARDHPDPELAKALEALAARCEKLAAEISGNGHAKS